MRKYYLALLLIIGLSVLAQAQQGQRTPIDVDYNQAGISQVVNDLQSKTGFHFYYNPVQFDSLRVTLTLRQQNLNVILNKMFEKTNFHYVITDQQEVILTKDLQISMYMAENSDNKFANPHVAYNNTTEY